MNETSDICEKCYKSISETVTKGLYQLRTLEFVCFDCLPAAEVAKYRGWKERVELSRKRSEQARQNFGVSK